MKLKKDSWHYKFNMWYHNSWNIKNDFCGYFWQTIASILITLFIATVSIASIFTIISFWKLSIPFLLFVTIISYIVDKYDKYRRRKKDEEYFNSKVEKPVGFFKAAWIKFKDKTCHKIEWT